MQARALQLPKKSQAVPSQQTQKPQLQGVNKHPMPTSTSRPTALISAISRGSTSPLSALSRSLVTHPSLGQHVVSQFQHSHGNRHVQRMLHVARQATGGADVEPDVEQEIHRARGGGKPLDQGVSGQMESAFGADFSGVRVHADSHADTLNRSLSARAFTTGRDIFFRQGAYNPGSSGGRELLAHELTHVVQQTGGAVRAKMVVNQPGDRFEQEADQAARAVIQREQQAGSTTKTGAALQRQAEEEAEPVQAQLLQRQTMEDEEAVQARFVQRQAEEDDESVQMQRVQRQMEEDESVQTQLLQRQSEEDDESVQMQRIQRQTEDEEPVQTRLAQRQSEDDEPVQMQWIQRQAATATEPATTAEAEPTEAEKAAALAAARMAEQLANQALTEGKNEVVKSRTAQAEAKSMGQAAKQEAEAKSPEVPAEAAYAAATQTGGADGEPPTGEMTDAMASEAAATSAPTANGAGPATVGAPVAVNGAGPGAVNGKAPASVEEDEAYQSVIKRIKGVAETQQTHAPAKSKADESQAAAESPSSEIEGKAQANQVDAMEQAEAPPFDAAAFKAQLLERIAALAPKTVEEADNFKKDDKLAGVKSDMQARAQEEQTASQAPLEAQTAAPPDTSRVEPKPVTPLSPAEPGPAPADVGAASAAPKSKGASEVEAPLAQNSRKLDDEMGDVEESDLEKSNEPAFLGALASKREAQTHAQTAPQAYRQAEGEQLAQAEAEAAGLAQDRTQAMHGDRAQLLTQVVGQQGQAKSKDEQARDKVAADIQKIYDETKTNVEAILSGLDGKVEKAFDEGAAAAKQIFEDFVAAKMDAYKERRYGGWFGWARWAKDKLLGMPSEVNAFYQDGRNLYLHKMDAVIDNVVAIVGTGITEAKAEIARGKQRIQAYVEQLPKDLQTVGQQAAADIQDQFADLEQSVADKQSELADTLANKYQENLQAIDSRIEEMKAANQGLVDKAINAVVGVVKAILKLKDLLFSVLAKIASVVTKIIKAPIEFLGNLVKGVKQGFTDFVSRISTHLQAALIAWLTGALGPVGIQVPDDLFSLPGIFSLVMQVLGLTWDYIRAKAVKLLGEPVVKALETGFEVFQILIRDGVAGLWEFVKEEFTNLKELVIDQIKEMVITEVIKAGVKWILGLLNPVGAFIKAAMAIYEIVKFFIERGSQIIEMVNAFIDAVAAIASGALGGAAKLVENALAKALPVVIGFLASLLGISGLAKKVQNLIMSLRKRIDKAIDTLILRAKKAAKKLLKKLGLSKEREAEAVGVTQPKDKEIGEAQDFSDGIEGHRLWVEVSGGIPVLVVASSAKTELKRLLNSPRVQAWVGEDREFATKVNRVKTAVNLADDKIEKLVAASKSGNDKAVESADSGLEKDMQEIAKDLKAIMARLNESRKPASIRQILSESNTEQIIGLGTERLSGDEILSKLGSISSALADGDRSNVLLRNIRKRWVQEGAGGAIYAPFVNDQGEAIRALGQELEGYPELSGSQSRFLFSLERGGALLGAQLAEGRAITHIRIRKVTDKAELTRLGVSGHQAQQRDELKAKIREVMANQPKEQIITISIAETSVSGSSALGLVPHLRDLTKEFPNLDIDYLILQQMLQLEQDESARKTQEANIGQVRQISRGGRIKVVIQSTAFIIGEDVEFQAAPNSKQSLVVFNGNEENLVAYEIAPEGDTSSRDVLIDLVHGAYTGLLPGIL